MFSNTRKDINFLEAYNLKEKSPKVSAKGFLVVIAAEIFLLGCIGVAMYSVVKVTEHKNTQLSISIEPLKGLENKINEIRYETKHLNAKKDIKNQVFNINETTYNTLTIFEEVLTSDMSIDDMKININQVSFVVKGDKEENFSQLMNNMESSGIFSKVEISSISEKDENGKREASINAEINRKW